MAVTSVLGRAGKERDFMLIDEVCEITFLRLFGSHISHNTHPLHRVDFTLPQAQR